MLVRRPNGTWCPPNPRSAEGRYFAELRDFARLSGCDDIIQMLEQPSRGSSFSQQALRGPCESRDDVRLAEVLRSSHRESVLVIQNVSLDWIIGLGSQWHIDVRFWVEHATSPNEFISNAVFDDDTRPRPRPAESGQDLRMHSIVGIHEHDLVGKDIPKDFAPVCGNNISRPGSMSSNRSRWKSFTKISYYRVHSHLYLFLLDTPPRSPLRPPIPNTEQLARKVQAHQCSRPKLNVPYSSNTNGLTLPQLFENFNKEQYGKCATFSVFRRFLGLERNLKILFSPDKREHVLDPFSLSYLLAASMWQSNLTFLDEEIKRIAFRDIRTPDKITNDRLHDRRQDLAELRKEVHDALKGIYPETLRSLGQLEASHKFPGFVSPANSLRDILEESALLESFLIDTFQLWMSTIGFREAELSMEQSSRATQLTQLATIYLPLSLVTGIFGMNVREINGATPRSWDCILVLVIITAGTVGLFGAYNLWKKRTLRSRRQSAAGTEKLV